MTESLPARLPNCAARRHISSNLLPPAPLRGRDLRETHHMHRKTLVAAACGAVAALVVGLDRPRARRSGLIDPQTTPPSVARAKARLSCPGGVVGVTSDRHVASTASRTAGSPASTSDRDALGYDVSAVGVFGLLVDPTQVRAAAQRRRRTTGCRARCGSSPGRRGPSAASLVHGVRPGRLLAAAVRGRLHLLRLHGGQQRRASTAGRCRSSATATCATPRRRSSGAATATLTSLQAAPTSRRARCGASTSTPPPSGGALKQIAVPHEAARPRARADPEGQTATPA